MVKTFAIETAAAAFSFVLFHVAKTGVEFAKMKVLPTVAQAANATWSSANSSVLLLPIYVVAVAVDKIGYAIAKKCGHQEYCNPIKTRIVISLATLIAAVGIGFLLGVSPVASAVVALVVIANSILFTDLRRPSIEKRLDTIDIELDKIPGGLECIDEMWVTPSILKKLIKKDKLRMKELKQEKLILRLIKYENEQKNSLLINDDDNE